MFTQDTYKEAHLQFGIDDVFVHEKIDALMLNKMKQRAKLTLDATDVIVKKHACCDMLLIFNKRVPSCSMIYRFLEFLGSDAERQRDLKMMHAIEDVEEMFESIKEKKFVLVTHSLL